MEPQPKSEDTEYSRYAWIRSIRTSKNITFLACTDGAKDFQVTIKGDTEVDGELKVGASIMVYGNDSTTPRGSYEFVALILRVVGTSDDSFPIQPKEHGDDFLRTIPETRGRSLKYAQRWKVRSHVAHDIHRYLHHLGFLQYFTPIITQADCEGAGETFSATSDWMNESLTVSGQLHLEVGMMSLGKVYTFSPCFRAEKSMTRKHLSEFWMLEVEQAHGDLGSMMDLCELLVKNACMIAIQVDRQKAQSLKDKMDFYHMDAPDDLPWPRITYKEACERLGLKWGDDIGSEAEQELTYSYKSPVFVTHYPKDMKPFYMRKDGEVAYCFDLIFPEVGELAGGSEREDDHDKLEHAMRETGMDMEKMQWYLNTRKWGSVPHAGFGLGFERLVMYLTDAEKVHDTIPFPVSY